MGHLSLAIFYRETNILNQNKSCGLSLKLPVKSNECQNNLFRGKRQYGITVSKMSEIYSLTCGVDSVFTFLCIALELLQRLSGAVSSCH